MARLRAAIAVALLVALALAQVLPFATAADPAPSFRLVDLDGASVTSGDLRGRVVVLDFFATWCEPCVILEGKLKEMHPSYGDEVAFLSVDIWPADTREMLVDYRQTHGIPWQIARDTDDVQGKYGVAQIPHVSIIDPAGFLVFEWFATPGWDADALGATMADTIERARAGTTQPIDVSALSIPLLLIIAALLSFFSPCSFPVLPAYMAYYLNLEAKGGKGTVRTAAGRGFVASLGMVLVYGLIAAVVVAIGFAAQATVPLIGPVVGAALIALGILTLLPYQYYRITRPLLALKDRIGAFLGRRGEPSVGAKLFAWGVGYGAAGFACVAPPFIGAVLNASALGRPEEAATGLLLYVAIVIGLMIGITVALQVAGDRALRRLNVWSGVIKYVSAVALLIAGAYLLLLFYWASIA